MGWETRRNGRQYYYVSERDGSGRVVKRYCGCWAMATFEEQMRRDFARLRRSEQMLKRVDSGAWDDLDATLREIIGGIDVLVNAALVEAGYRRVAGGPWRKQRKERKSVKEPMAQTTQTGKTGKAAAVTPAWTPPDTVDERLTIVRNALSKTATQTQTAQALLCLRKHPNEVTLHTGNSLEAVLNYAAPDPVMRTIMKQESDAMRKALAGENPSPIENLLIERILACRVSVNYYELVFAATMKKSQTQSVTIDQVDAVQKRVERANRQYLAAIKTLAQVRRLQIPVNVQVNVAAAGGQQVNIAGNVTPQTPQSPLHLSQD